MTRRMSIMLLIVVVLFGGIFGFQLFKARQIAKAMAGQGVPPQTVSTITARAELWQPESEAIGSLQAARGADIAAEVSGIVARINFRSGDEVEAGALLLQLNADTDLARLQSLQAEAELARTTYLRDQQQLKDHAVSQATIDADSANLKSAEARVAEQQALVDKKFIRAPFSGRLGIRAVDLGEYLNPGMTIVTLQALDPIFVNFYLPQKSISKITVGQTVSVHSDAFPESRFAGTIAAINPKVDAATRNVEVQATLPNPRRLLLPGMFVTTTIQVGEPQPRVTLPQTAITYNPYGDIVYLVEERGKGPTGQPALVAQQKFVTIGETRGDQNAILVGVEAGDVVVTSGQIKLRNGTPVVINNAIVPANDAAPTPADD